MISTPDTAPMYKYLIGTNNADRHQRDTLLPLRW